MFNVFFYLLVILSIPMLSYAQGTNFSNVPLALFIAGNLDVTSFPNSIGPRKVKAKYFFSDYGGLKSLTIMILM